MKDEQGYTALEVQHLGASTRLGSGSSQTKHQAITASLENLNIAIASFESLVDLLVLGNIGPKAADGPVVPIKSLSDFLNVTPDKINAYVDTINSNIDKLKKALI